MSDWTAKRIAKAQHLRQKAERFRYLATCITDERAIEIIEGMGRENDEEAAQIEQELNEARVPLHASGVR
jgi:hypothetical protein